MSKVRVAFVGCGGRNRYGHMRDMKDFSDVDIVAVCDPVEQARNSIADEFGIELRYRDLNHMADEIGLDAVVIAAPAHLNYSISKISLERGIHTLIEKPPGMNVSETEDLRDIASRTGAKALVGFQRRFHPMVVAAREMIEEKGPMLQIVGEFHKSISAAKESNKYDPTVLDNLIYETPIHAIDLVLACASSEVVEVQSVVRRSISEYKDVHAALILFENGCVAQISANYTGSGRLQRYEFHGNDISAYLSGISEGYVISHGNRIDLEDSVGSGGSRELDRFFIDCIKDDRPIGLPGATLDQSVKTMQLVEDILGGLSN